VRVLICFSSLVRGFRVAFESFRRRILDVLPSRPDIVGHFPPSAEQSDLALLEQAAARSLIRIEADPELSWELTLRRNLEPAQRHGIKGNLLQWHSMKQCRELKREMEGRRGARYDLVLWSRPDLYFFNRLDPIDELDPAAIYFPSHDAWHGYHDRFCFGNSEIMDRRMGIYDYFLHTFAWPDGHPLP